MPKRKRNRSNATSTISALPAAADPKPLRRWLILLGGSTAFAVAIAWFAVPFLSRDEGLDRLQTAAAGFTEQAAPEIATLANEACDVGSQLLRRFPGNADAEAAYRKAVELTPRLARGYASLAGFHLQVDPNSAEALRLARTAVEMEPIAYHYFLLFSAAQRCGDEATAATAIQQVAALEPNNAEYQRLRDTMS